MPILERTSWQAIHAELRRRIRNRVWKPGEAIPNEADLAEEFGCARTTVNRALRELAEAGLVDRRRKAGTRVALHPVRKATLDIPVIRIEVEKRGLAYRHDVLGHEMSIPPPTVANALGLPGDVPLLHVETLHRAGGRPHALEDRWINPAAAPGIQAADLELMSANEWLVLNAPFTRGDIAFAAANATDTEARRLDVRPGDALFVVDRITWDGPNPVTKVRLAYAPGFRMLTTL